MNAIGLLAVFLSFCLVARHAEAGDAFYVSPAGDNSNPGTRQSPWATPGYGSRQLGPGDTLIILGGRYVLKEFDADIVTPPSGEAGGWITIRGEAGNRPVLAGRDNLLCGIDLSGASYVRIENIELTHDSTAAGTGRYFRDGIVALGEPARQIVLKNLYIHHIDEFGVNFQDVKNLKMLNCRIEYCGFGAVGGPRAGPGGGWRKVLIKECKLSFGGHYYQGGDGSDRPYDRPDGFGIEHSRGPIEIAYTTAEHNYGDGFDSKAANTYIHHSVVANNSCDGVKLWGGGTRIENTLIYGTGDGGGGDSPWAGIVISTSSPGATFEIANVTLHDNPERHAYPLYVQYDDPDVPVDVVIRNTIVANGYGPAYFGPSVSLTAENNIFFRPGASEKVEAHGRTYTAAQLRDLGTGNISKDPRFVKPAWGSRGNYYLKDRSPAIDAGTPTEAPADDLEGRGRPQGAGYDIGAYEHPAAGCSILRPRKLRARPKSAHRILLLWRDRSQNETGFKIERKPGSGGRWKKIAVTEADTTRYADRGLAATTLYYYRVKAFNRSCHSTYSNIAKAKTEGKKQ